MSLVGTTGGENVSDVAVAARLTCQTPHSAKINKCAQLGGQWRLNDRILLEEKPPFSCVVPRIACSLVVNAHLLLAVCRKAAAAAIAQTITFAFSRSAGTTHPDSEERQTARTLHRPIHHYQLRH